MAQVTGLTKPNVETNASHCVLNSTGTLHGFVYDTKHATKKWAYEIHYAPANSVNANGYPLLINLAKLDGYTSHDAAAKSCEQLARTLISSGSDINISVH